jgi:DNA-directed RNA polymerase subunit RPC12/RpoP
MALFKRKDRARSASDQAWNAPAQALLQTEAVEQSRPGGGGIGAIMASLGMDYGVDYVKRVDCPSCGGVKKLASPSAYLYCDYCGTLADFDFIQACTNAAQTPPRPEYAHLVNALQPRLRTALQARDRDDYRALQHQILDAYATACPHALSHRISDPDYRHKLVAFMADSAVTNDFDPEFAALMDEMKARVGALQWSGGLMARRTGGPSFHALVEVCERQAIRANQIMDSCDLIDCDPDHASPVVRTRMHHSLFSQGWLPMLETDDAAWMIDRLGLGGQYSKIEQPVDIEKRTCGACGRTVSALSGSKAIVCDHCGRVLDVAGAQTACGKCGGPITFPVATRDLQCPHCQARTERVGWT